MPVSRFDRCPRCLCDLRVCRACNYFDPKVLGQCRHERAERLVDKQLANFCTYFRAHLGEFAALELSAAEQAQQALDALFDAPAGAPDAPASEAGPEPEQSVALDSLFRGGAADKAPDAVAPGAKSEAELAQEQLDRLFAGPDKPV